MSIEEKQGMDCQIKTTTVYIIIEENSCKLDTSIYVGREIIQVQNSKLINQCSSKPGSLKKHELQHHQNLSL